MWLAEEGFSDWQIVVDTSTLSMGNVSDVLGYWKVLNTDKLLLGERWKISGGVSKSIIPKVMGHVVRPRWRLLCELSSWLGGSGTTLSCSMEEETGIHSRPKRWVMMRMPLKGWMCFFVFFAFFIIWKICICHVLIREGKVFHFIIPCMASMCSPRIHPSLVGSPLDPNLTSKFFYWLYLSLSP